MKHTLSNPILFPYNTVKFMNKYLVLTTINPPNEVVEQFSKLTDWNIVVVADRKTPENWNHKNVTFLSVKDQEKIKFKTSKELPWNSYTRKNLGYLYAIKNGADLIAETDDDNFPLAGWGKLPGPENNWLLKGEGFVNIYNLFSDVKIWPRGFPLGKIKQKNSFGLSEDKSDVGVWQSLVNRDTDVDAIYRLTINEEVEFDKNISLDITTVQKSLYDLSLEAPVNISRRSGCVLDTGVLCPFNSQNTFFLKNSFEFLYLPSTVTMRATDIYRGLVAQPIMWQAGLHLGFFGPTAYQERNAHDFMKDFESEIPVYQNTEKIADLAQQAAAVSNSSSDGLLNTYKYLAKEKIVQNKEVKILDAWLDDIAKYRSI